MIDRRAGNKQSGAVLIVALVMLVVVTLLGLSSINGVSQQLKSSLALQDKQEAYQLSLSEIEAQLGRTQTADGELDTSLFIEPMNSATQTFSLSPNQLVMIDNEFTQEVRVDYRGAGAPPSGYSIGIFSGQRFEIDSDATRVNSQVESNQTQGVNIAVMKSE